MVTIFWQIIVILKIIHFNIYSNGAEMFFPLQNGSNMIRIDNTQDVYSLQIMLNLIALNEDLIKRNLKAEHRAMLR